MSVTDSLFLMSLIPSVLSIACSSLVLINIVASRELRGRVFQQVVALLAITDIFKCASWVLGNKYENPTDLCYVQEYIFQVGSLAQAIMTTVICGVAHITVHRGRAPKENHIFMVVGGFVVLILFLFACMIRFRTARLFCDFDEDRFRLGEPNSPLGALILAYLVPIYISVILDLVLATVIHKKLHWARKALEFGGADNGRKSMAHTFASRLLAYPFIIFICTVFNTLFVGILVFTTANRQWMGAPAAIMMSSSGVFICANYFYVQKTKAPVITKMSTFLLSGATVGSESVRSNLNLTHVTSPMTTAESTVEMGENIGEIGETSAASAPRDVQTSSIERIDVSVTFDDVNEMLSIE